jgi:hypothetical protein
MERYDRSTSHARTPGTSSASQSSSMAAGSGSCVPSSQRRHVRGFVWVKRAAAPVVKPRRSSKAWRSSGVVTRSDAAY